MALIKCTECGKEVSDTAKVCPNCGFKLKKEAVKHKKQPIYFIATAIAIVAFIIYGMQFDPPGSIMILLVLTIILSVFMGLGKWNQVIKWTFIVISVITVLGIMINITEHITIQNEQRKNYDRYSYTELLKMAAEDDANAMYAIAKRIDMPSNKESVFDWYLKAAKLGHADAQNDAAICLVEGIGTERNPKEGFNWMLKAAKQGKANSMLNLGDFYAQGVGTEINYEEAYKWTKKSADLGYAEAYAPLGNFYYNGFYVEKDVYEAVKWFKKSVDEEIPLGYVYLAGCLMQGEGIEKNRDKAITYLKIASAKGEPHATAALKALGETEY